MKKLIIILAVLVSAVFNCEAQPNGGFENWATASGIQEPVGWQTLNFLSLFGDPISAYKATGIDKHSGSYALKLQTIFLSHNPAPGTLRDTMGYVFTGLISISPPSIKYGIPYVGRPEKLEFWSKYIPVGADHAGASVILQKWNGTKTDTIAIGSIAIDTTAAYTLFQVNLNYLSNELSDTVVIGFSSSYLKVNARAGSTLFIDDVALTGWVGIDEHSIIADKVKIFPNPAKENITIQAQIDEAVNVQVIDIAGKVEGTYQIQNYNVNIKTDAFADGVYFYKIRDKKNRILTSGKFNVVK